MAKQPLFAFEAGEYTPYYAWINPARTSEEIEKEYRRLRVVEMKRLKRLEVAGFVTAERAEQLRTALPTITALKKTGDVKAVGKSLAFVASVLRKEKTVTESRKRLKEIEQRLSRALTPGELETFENFMRAWRLYAPGGVSSERAASDFNVYQNMQAKNARDFWSNYDIYKTKGGMF